MQEKRKTESDTDTCNSQKHQNYSDVLLYQIWIEFLFTVSLCRWLTPKPCSLNLRNVKRVTLLTSQDPCGVLIHSEMDDRWHAHAFTLVISLLNPLGSNYLWGEQKAGARRLLQTWQLNEQHSPLFYEANLQSSRNETRSNEGKCLYLHTQTAVTRARVEHHSVKWEQSEYGAGVRKEEHCGSTWQRCINVQEQGGKMERRKGEEQ